MRFIVMFEGEGDRGGVDRRFQEVEADTAMSAFEKVVDEVDIGYESSDIEEGDFDGIQALAFCDPPMAIIIAATRNECRAVLSVIDERAG